MSHVSGWLTRGEGTFLYHAAGRTIAGHAIVEIGSFKGRSTICLAKGALASGRTRVFAIDPHCGNREHQRQFGRIDTFDDFKRNLAEAGVAHAVQAIRDTSVNVAAGFGRRVGLLFIDGNHEFQAVRDDLRCWLPLVDAGGFVAVHDSWQIWGPHAVTARLLLSSRQVRRPRLIDTMTVVEKSAHNSAMDRLHNRLFVAWRLLWGFKGFLTLKVLGSRTERP